SVTGHRERLALLDGIHDVFRPHAQVPLADLVLKHDPTIATYGTACYIASQHFDHRALARNARLPGHKLRGSARLLAELAKREWQALSHREIHAVHDLQVHVRLSRVAGVATLGDRLTGGHRVAD